MIFTTLFKQAVMEKSPQPCEPGDLHNPHSIKVYKLNVYYVKVVFPPICFALKKLHGSNSPLKRLSRKIFNLLRLKRNRRLRDPLMGAMRILPAEELWGNTRAFCVFCFPTQVGMHEMCKGIPNKLWSYSQTNLQTLPIWCIPAL